RPTPIGRPRSRSVWCTARLRGKGQCLRPMGERSTTNRTVDDDDLPWRKPVRTVKDLPALAILWSLEEAGRVGEVALGHGTGVLGRGPAQAEDGAARLVFSRQRPGATIDQPPLGGTRISRVQLRIKPRADGALEISSVGKCAMLVRSAEVK